RRGVRAARRDAGSLRRVSTRASARSRVRLAAPVRHVWSHERLVAGPVSVLPPLEHPPSRPRLTPLSLAVFPRLATAALDLVFPALCAVCEARLGPRRRDPLCGPCWDGIAGIVPVPLAADRERERGFNQAALLAERVAQGLALPVRARWLARGRATRPQSDLPAAERSANVRGAFRAAPAVAGRHVLLVD